MAAVTVEITRRAVLRAPPPASAHGGGGGKHWSPLTPFDRASTDGYIPNVFAWNAPAPDNDAILDGLLAAVARYPHLAARIGVDDRGRKCFHLNDAGVLVVEATADADLADTPLVAHVSELYPKADKVRNLFGDRSILRCRNVLIKHICSCMCLVHRPTHACRNVSTSPSSRCS
jgi:hypothetical protein